MLTVKGLRLSAIRLLRAVSKENLILILIMFLSEQAIQVSMPRNLLPIILQARGSQDSRYIKVRKFLDKLGGEGELIENVVLRHTLRYALPPAVNIGAAEGIKYSLTGEHLTQERWPR